MAFDDLSMFEYAIFGIVGIVALGAVVLFTSMLGGELNDAWQENPQIDATSKQLVDYNQDNYAGWIDKIMFSFIIAVALSVILVARLSNASPILWVIMLVLFIFVTIGAAWLGNFYIDMTDTLSINPELLFPLSFHVLNNLVLYSLVIGIAGLVLSRTGTGADL